MFRRGAVLLFAMLACGSAVGQESSARPRPEPKTLLHELEQRYKEARYYRVEAVEEQDNQGDLRRIWTKAIRSAAAAPGNRYRYTARTQDANWTQVSDGTTEWIYQQLSREYMRQPTPAKGPFRFNGGPWDYAHMQLIDAQDLLKEIPHLLPQMQNPAYQPEETLMLTGSLVPCFVLQGKGWRSPGWSPNVQVELTFWIDQKTHLLRKSRSVMRGPSIVNEPNVNYTRTTVVTYPVMELGEPPADLFSFTLPDGAKQVARFEGVFRPKVKNLAGKAAPAVTFKPAGGKAFSLQSLAGKPVLLEFWATWCGPCVAAMPSLEKLYPKLEASGVTVLTIDEDYEAEAAVKFLADRDAKWTNIHDKDGDINRAFPGDGIPEFVLIDRGGTILGSNSGFDEAWLNKMVKKASKQDARRPAARK